MQCLSCRHMFLSFPMYMKALDNRSLLESVIYKLKEEAAHHEHKLLDAFENIKSLNHTILKAENTFF